MDSNQIKEILQREVSTTSLEYNQRLLEDLKQVRFEESDCLLVEEKIKEVNKVIALIIKKAKPWETLSNTFWLGIFPICYFIALLYIIYYRLPVTAYLLLILIWPVLGIISSFTIGAIIKNILSGLGENLNYKESLEKESEDLYLCRKLYKSVQSKIKAMGEVIFIQNSSDPISSKMMAIKQIKAELNPIEYVLEVERRRSFEISEEAEKEWREQERAERLIQSQQETNEKLESLQKRFGVEK